MAGQSGIMFRTGSKEEEPERKRKNLNRLGVEPGKAYAFSRAHKEGWAVAQSLILGATITVARLVKRGYEAMTTHYSKVCPHFQNPTLFPNA